MQRLQTLRRKLLTTNIQSNLQPRNSYKSTVTVTKQTHLRVYRRPCIFSSKIPTGKQFQLNSLGLIYFEPKSCFFFFHLNVRLLLRIYNHKRGWDPEADVKKLVPFIYSGQLGLGPELILERCKLIRETEFVICDRLT